MPWFVATCMVLISGSLATVVYLQFDLAVAEAGWIGFAALMLMVLAEFISARSRERAAVVAQIDEIDAIAARLTQDLARIEGRFSELEKALPKRIDEKIDLRMVGMLGDIEMLDDQLRVLEENVAALRPSQPARGEVSVSSGGLEGLDTAEAIEVIRRAIDDNRIEVLLQPVVTLPQRRVRYYEALTRLRGEDGRTILPGAYIPVAEPAGLMPLIDNILLFRCVQIVRRMMRRTPDMAIFCNVSAHSLVDGEFFPQFVAYMEEHRELAEVLVFELPQSVMETLGPIEQAGLDSLADLGFRFSVDHVESLDIDGPRYAAQRIRFAKIDAHTLLNPPPGAHIHVSDLPRLLARSNIDVIASRVESEAELVDLLDYDISLGQGHLFSPPRPVRSEILGDAARDIEWARAS